MLDELVEWMEWLYSLVDVSDLYTLLTVAVVGFVAYFFFNKDDTKNKRSVESRGKLTPKATTLAKAAYDDEGFVARMKAEKRDVLVVYGSQTGTAEELSGRLAKNFTRYARKSLVLDPEEVDDDQWDKMGELKAQLVVLCMATYGEGDPTDNAQKFIEWLKNASVDLSGVRYAVFGLGNKTYEHYNEVAKLCDKRMEELGAERIMEIGMGDDDANLEEDFCKWRDAFLPAAAASFAWELDPEAESARQYRLELVNVVPEKLYSGEFGRLNSHLKPRAPFDMKTPYFAPVIVNRELHSEKSDRSCRHIEFDLSSVSVRYETGDHLGVYPTNEKRLVDRIIELLDFDPEQAFKLINLDEESNKKHPFPCPTTFRVALGHYVDIAAPLKAHLLKALADWCSVDEEKERLIRMSATEGEGHTEYTDYILKGRRSIVDILGDFPSCKPPIDLLLELLPRLQVRFYSISSSPKIFDKSIHITAVVTEYAVEGRQINGVCTTYLKGLKPGDTVPIFVRKSTMRISHADRYPVIMIGPGTGLAPFRGFIQERMSLHDKGTVTKESKFALFFGCRHPEIDYIYQDELECFHDKGVLSHLSVAFSRQGTSKVYVQHKLQEQEELVYSAFKEGYILVCGDARNMARDVQATIVRIVAKKEEVGEEEASAKFKEMEKNRRYLADVWS